MREGSFCFRTCPERAESYQEAASVSGHRPLKRDWRENRTASGNLAARCDFRLWRGFS